MPRRVNTEDDYDGWHDHYRRRRDSGQEADDIERQRRRIDSVYDDLDNGEGGSRLFNDAGGMKRGTYGPTEDDL